MLGQIDPQRRDVYVYGGGISGLIAAYYTSKAGYRVRLFEQANRLGGILQSTHTPYGLAESAATSVRASSVVRQFCHDLGIQLHNVDAESKARFIVRSGKLRKMPLSVGELGAMIWRAATQRSNPEHQTLGDWSRHHLGEMATDYLLNPFTTGIYAASPDELDLDSVYPQLRAGAGKTLVANFLANKLRGRKHPKDEIQMMTPTGGMQDFVDRIAADLMGRKNVEIRLNTPAPKLEAGPNHVICTPAGVAGKLLVDVAPETASALQEVRYAPMVSATVFVRIKNAGHNPRGVGFLVPAREGLKTLGVLYSSSSFPNRSSQREQVSVFTVMIGGTRHPDAINWSTDDVQRAIKQALQLIDAEGWEIVDTVVHRWPNAIPVYDKNIANLRRTASSDWCSAPGNVLFGNYTGDLAIRTMIEAWDKLAI